MPAGIWGAAPPPMFRQGASALSKLLFFSALSILCMVADLRLGVMAPVRAAFATVIHPLARVLRLPVDAAQGVGAYGQGLQEALSAEAQARRRITEQSLQVAQLRPLQLENARLRALLGLQPQWPVRSVAAEVVYEAADPYSRRVLINRGLQHGIEAGSPVVNELGVLGQVLRVHPFSAEVKLLIDHDSLIPVMNARSQVRALAQGAERRLNDGVAGMMSLRYVAPSADIRVGDLLTTSGLDGVYPPGIHVGTVTDVEREAEDGFAHIRVLPAAPAEWVHHVLVLEPVESARRRNAPESAAAVAEAASAASDAPSGGRP